MVNGSDWTGAGLLGGPRELFPKMLNGSSSSCGGGKGFEGPWFFLSNNLKFDSNIT